MIWQFNKKYFLLTCFFIAIEVFIALYVRDSFVRPYFGDFLVVILIYCFIKSFLNIAVWKTGIFVLLFAFLIETLQYFQIVDKLGLSKNNIAKTVLGYGFEWWDILAYTLGILTVLIIEKIFKKV